MRRHIKSWERVLENNFVDRKVFKQKGVHGNLYDEDVKLFVRNFKRNIQDKFKDVLAEYLCLRHGTLTTNEAGILASHYCGYSSFFKDVKASSTLCAKLRRLSAAGTRVTNRFTAIEDNIADRVASVKNIKDSVDLMFDFMSEHDELEDVHLVPLFRFGPSMLLWDNSSLRRLLIVRCGVEEDTLPSGIGEVIKRVFAGAVKKFTRSGSYRVGRKGATFHTNGHLVSLHLSSDIEVRCL